MDIAHNTLIDTIRQYFDDVAQITETTKFIFIQSRVPLLAFCQHDFWQRQGWVKNTHALAIPNDAAVRAFARDLWISYFSIMTLMHPGETIEFIITSIGIRSDKTREAILALAGKEPKKATRVEAVAV